MAEPRESSAGSLPAPAGAWRRSGRVVSWAIEHYVAVAGLVAVVATTFYGLAYARFYGELNLTPEQAGMTPGQILTQSAVGGLTMTLLFALTLFCWLLVPVAPIRLDWRGDDPGSWRRLAGNFLLSLLSFGLVLAFLAAMIGLDAETAFGFSSVTAVLFLAVSFRVRRKGWRPVLRPRPLQFRFERYLVCFVAVALPIGLLGTGLGTFAAADNLGEEVASVGTTTEDLTVLGLPFFGVDVEPALVHWQERDLAPADMPYCVLYLGGSGGDATFYDRGSRTTFHVPASDVVIRIRDDLTNCDGPINVHRPGLVRRGDGTLVCLHGAWESYYEPRFRYRWVFNGPRFPDSRFRQGRAMGSAFLARHDIRAVHCQVFASSRLGRDYAVSRTLRLNRR